MNPSCTVATSGALFNPIVWEYFYTQGRLFQRRWLVEYERGHNKRNTILQERQWDERKYSRKKKGKARRYRMILTFTGAKRHDWCLSLTSNLQISQMRWLMERRLTGTLSSLHPSLFSWCRKAVTPPAVLPSYILPLPSTALLIYPDWCLLSAISLSFPPECVFLPAGAVWKMSTRKGRPTGMCSTFSHANTMLMVLSKRLICCQLEAIRKQFSLTLWV